MKYFMILTIAIITFLFGCTKELNQIPKSSASKEAVFGSEDGLRLYTNSFYDLIPTEDEIMRSDNMTDYSVRKDIPDFLRPNFFGPIESTGWDWSPLRNINYFIENCNNSEVDLEVRENYIGLAKFFRAYWYFGMVKRFGDVPWYSKPIDPSDIDALYKPRDTRTLVEDSILADLNYACDKITLTNDPSSSRITKWVAYAFKSRFCLYVGTFRKYHSEFNLGSTANQWLNEAESSAKTVIDNSGFKLHESEGVDQSYRSLFVSEKPLSDEVMLATIIDANLGVLGDAGWYWTSATYGDRLNLSRVFVNTYLNIDGTPFTNNANYKTQTFVEETQNRDKRLQQTIRTPGLKRIKGGIEVSAPPVFSYTFTGYMPRKFTLDDTKYDQDWVSINSIPVVRYAEVLLNYAEAKAELGTITDSDWKMTIGALRSRAGITGGLASLPTITDQYLKENYFPDIDNPVILEIRRCRSIELVFEGFRFDDLVRWKKGDLMAKIWNGFYVPALNVPMDLDNDGVLDVCFVMGAPNNRVDGVDYLDVSPSVGGKPNPMLLSEGTSGEITWLKDQAKIWEDKMYLYPIPESALLNNDRLGQNPGW